MKLERFGHCSFVITWGLYVRTFRVSKHSALITQPTFITVFHAIHPLSYLFDIEGIILRETTRYALSKDPELRVFGMKASTKMAEDMLLTLHRQLRDILYNDFSIVLD